MEYIVWVVALITAFANVKFIYKNIKNKDYEFAFVFILTLLYLLYTMYGVIKN